MIAVLFLLTSLLPFTDGYEFLAQGKYTYARTAFRNQLRREPDNARARIGLGLAEQALGNGPAAVESLLAGLREAPDDATGRRGLAEALLGQAQDRMARGHYDDATRYLLMDAADQAHRAAKLMEDSAEACILAAQAELELGEWDRARDSVRQAEERGADTSSMAALQAEVLYFETVAAGGEDPSALDRAVGSLRRLAQEAPDSPVPLRRLGDLCHAFQRWPEALGAWEESLEREPFQRPVLEGLLAYLPFPDFRPRAAGILRAAADRLLRDCDRADPRPGLALFGVGQAALLEFEPEEALALFEQALQRDPTLAVACQLGRGQAAFRAGRHDVAAEAFLGAIREDPDTLLERIRQVGLETPVSASLVFLANQATQAERPEEARDLWTTVVRLLPEDAAAWNNLAFLCRETRRYEESYAAYRRLLELTPRDPRVLNDTALILHYHLDRKDEARDLYRLAVEEAQRRLADPDSPEAVKSEAQAALTDARTNLARLDQSDRAAR